MKIFLIAMISVAMIMGSCRTKKAGLPRPNTQVVPVENMPGERMVVYQTEENYKQPPYS